MIKELGQSPYSASIKVDQNMQRNVVSKISTSKTVIVASHPKFNKRTADKSNSPENEYNESVARQTLATSNGSRTGSRVLSSTKNGRVLVQSNASIQPSLLNVGNTQKQSLVAGRQNSVRLGFGNMPNVMKRPKSSVAVTSHNKQYRPFH